MADLPSSMQAVVADGAGGISLVDRPVPTPADREVLIKVAAARMLRPGMSVVVSIDSRAQGAKVAENN